MPYGYQVTVDSADPHAMADWWAETMGWKREPSNPEFIRSMVDQGFAEESETLVHNGELVWRTGAAIIPPAQPEGALPHRILFQSVPEPKRVKNRVHLDVRLGDDDKDEVRARLEQRGATFLHAGQQGPSSWYTMTDPEGNEFCVG